MSLGRLDAVTRRYAGALYELAVKRGALSEVQRDVERVAAELSVPAVQAYLFDTRVPLAQRRAKLAPLSAAMHRLTRNFVDLLFDKRREEVLRGLSEAFTERRRADEGSAHGVVESAEPLDRVDIGRLEAALSRVLGKTVTLENAVAPELIAGVRVTADNKMIDYSARGRLEALRKRMMAAPLFGGARA